MLFLVVGGCGFGDDDEQVAQSQLQVSGAGMGASVVTAVTTVAGPIVDLLNTLTTQIQQSSGQQSSILGVEVVGDPVPIPCEQGTFITATPTFDDGVLTSVHVVASGCVLNNGTVTLNFTADVTDLVFGSTCLVDDQSLIVPSAFKAVINGAFTLAQDGVDVDFNMTSLGMAFSNITYNSFTCSITGLKDIVTGIISTTIPVINQQATFNFGNGSVTFDVIVIDESDLLEMFVEGDMTLTTPCFEGGFHMSTSGEVGGSPLFIPEGQTCPTGGKVRLTGDLDEIVDFDDDPSPCSSPACTLPTGSTDSIP